MANNKNNEVYDGFYDSESNFTVQLNDNSPIPKIKKNSKKVKSKKNKQ